MLRCDSYHDYHTINVEHCANSFDGSLRGLYWQLRHNELLPPAFLASPLLPYNEMSIPYYCK